MNSGQVRQVFGIRQDIEDRHRRQYAPCGVDQQPQLRRGDIPQPHPDSAADECDQCCYG